ncbi:Uncharacterised protein [Vibrio cholerae]|nr:Uncharacterised protein [Vibrio cholerae]
MLPCLVVKRQMEVGTSGMANVNLLRLIGDNVTGLERVKD